MVGKYLPYYKRNLRVAGPVMLSQLSAAMAGIVDSIMVGHYGTTELAAVSFANSIFFTFMVFAMGALMGLTPLVGYAFVQNRHEDVGRLWRGGVVWTLMVTAAMLVAMAIMLAVMPHMGQDADVLATATPYYILAMISTLPFLLMVIEKQMLEGLGNTTIAMCVSLVMNLVNIPLNWILIFGHCGLPAMGATGAGIATLIVRTAQPIVLYALMWAHQEWRQYLVGEKARWAEVWKVGRLGLPIGLQQMMEIFAFTFSVTLVGWISKEAVAAYQIANHMADLMFMVSIGIGAATVIRVSHQYGAGKIYDMHMAAHAALHMGLVWSLFGATVCIGGCGLIPEIFTEDAEVIRIAKPLLILCGLFQISDAMQCIGGSMLRGLADVRVPMIYAFVTYILITMPLGYILMFPVGLGVNGIWIAFIVGLTIAAVLMLTRWHKIAPKVEE